MKDSFLSSLHRREMGLCSRKETARHLGMKLTAEIPLSFEPDIYNAKDSDCLGNRLLVTSETYNVHLYDVTPLTHYEEEPSYNLVSFWSKPFPPSVSGLPCGRWTQDYTFFTVSGRSNTISVIDTQGTVEIETININGSDITLIHEHCYLAPQMVAVGCNNSSVAVIDLRTGLVCQCLSKEQTGDVYGLHWSPVDDRLIVSASHGITLLWDSRHYKKPLASIRREQPSTRRFIPHVRFFDGNHIICMEDVNTMAFYNIYNLELLKTVNNIKLRPTKTRIRFDINKEAGLVYCAKGKNVSVLDLNMGKEVEVLQGHLFPINLLQFNELSKELYTFSEDQSIIWAPSVYGYCTE